MHSEVFPSHKQKQATFISLLAMKLGMFDVSKDSSCSSCFSCYNPSQSFSDSPNIELISNFAMLLY